MPLITINVHIAFLWSFLSRAYWICPRHFFSYGLGVALSSDLHDLVEHFIVILVDTSEATVILSIPTTT
jgi:hypothetical protein